MELGSELAEEEESPAQGETPSDNGNLEALRLLLAYHQISADAAQMRHILGHGETATGDDLVRLAKRQGGRAKLIDASWEELETLPLPGLVEGRDGRFLLLGRAGREAVLLHDAVTEQTREVSRAEFEAAFTTKVLLLTTRHATAGPQRRFDVSWFIPALVRYRRHYWRPKWYRCRCS